MTRGKQQRGIETQGALLEAAGRVFSRMEYDKAKLKDISDEAGISLGSLYFHFGNKDDVAAAVLKVQQERMGEVIAGVQAHQADNERARLLLLIERVADLVTQDSLVQAGVRLVNSLPEQLQAVGHGAFGELQKTIEAIITAGVNEGSVTSDVPVDVLAEVVNEIYVGAQALAGMFDGWSSLPRRVKRALPHIERILQPR